MMQGSKDQNQGTTTRKFLLEFDDLFGNMPQIFGQFLYDAWVAGLTISGFKSAIGMPGVNIVRMVCDYDGRRPKVKKVQKILDWLTPQNVKQARGFVGIVVYYRIFIKDFATIAAPIYQLFRKGKGFIWHAS